MAPLDIPPTLYKNYQWIDPGAGHIPRNHWFIDMFDYGLPRMYLAHQSIQAGEFPWWDPYSSGGRPLITEAHMSMSDPIRLLMFRLFPFVTAYNWTRIIQSLFTGVSVFMLLRFLGFSQYATVLGALSFQFAGLQALFFYPENVPNSLQYYPLLWVALAKYGRTSPLLAIALGGLLCGAIILAGNPQSHPYLILFLVCFALGYGTPFGRESWTIFVVTGSAFVLGCMLAAPVLLAQVELFGVSSREPVVRRLGKQLFTGIFSITGIFPWPTGSYRSVDLGKSVGSYGASYVVHLGTPLFMIALVGLFAWRRSAWRGRPETRTALLLLLIYFVGVCSTPLVNLLYHRAAGLALLGLVVMFGIGTQVLIDNSFRYSSRVFRSIVMLLAAAVIVTHLFAFAIYPRLKERVLKVALQIDAANQSMPSVPEVRRFQINNLPNDITFRNPEPLLAFVGALSLLLVTSTNLKWRRNAWRVAFVLNLVPLLVFFCRTVPYSPIQYWSELLAGGPEQRRIARLLGPHLRLLERAPGNYGRLDFIFPGSTAIYYGIHTLLDYSSFPLTAPGQTTTPRDHNLLYASESRTEPGKILELKTNQVRYAWANGQTREVRIARETPNSIQLQIASGAPGELIRTDTYYPGWRVERPTSVTQYRSKGGFWAFSIPAEGTDLVLRYQPTYAHLTNPACVAGLIVTSAFLLWSLRNRLPERSQH